MAKQSHYHTFLLIFALLTLNLTGCATAPSQEEALQELYAQYGILPRPDRSPAESLDSDSEAKELRQLQIEQALQERDLVVGMTQSQVRSAWGEPRDVEVAGNPLQGNQRWIYFQGLSSRWSLSPARVVYFESGQVVGWETRQF